MGVKIVRKTGEPIGILVKRFKKTLERSGKLRELRRREHYEKPSEVRRRAEIRRQHVVKNANGGTYGVVNRREYNHENGHAG